MSDHPVLRAADVTIEYRIAGQSRPALHEVSLEVAPGEALAIIGRSGSGKSTLVSALLGLLPDNARVVGGTLEILGHPMTRRRGRDLRDLLASVGYVPQDPGSSLNPVRSIRSQLAEAIRVRGLTRDRAEITRLSEEALALAGIRPPSLVLDKYPHQLSGGQLQRVLIAAAIVHRPKLLVADEPTSALDVTTQREILDLIDDLRESLGMTMLLVTHDLSLAADRSSRIAVLHEGSVVEVGPTAKVLGESRDSHTRSLLADVPRPIAAAIESRASAAGRAGSTDAPLLAVNDASVVYRGHGGIDHLAVDRVSFSVARGTTHALVGESGSGKTTLSRLVLGLVPAATGSISLEGRVIDLREPAALRALRRRVQYVYQNPFGSLDPQQSVQRIIDAPIRHYLDVDRSTRQRRVADLLDAVGLPAGTASRRPRELSGGQRQRVAIARALAASPEFIILDEPTSALDVSVQAQILRLLKDLQQELGLTYLFVSHDLRVVAELADTMTVLRAGVPVESGPAASVLRLPTHPYTQRLVASVPRGLAGAARVVDEDAPEDVDAVPDADLVGSIP